MFFSLKIKSKAVTCPVSRTDTSDQTPLPANWYLTSYVGYHLLNYLMSVTIQRKATLLTTKL